VPLIQAQADVPHRLNGLISFNHTTGWKFTGPLPPVSMLKLGKPHRAIADNPEKAHNHDQEPESFHDVDPGAERSGSGTPGQWCPIVN
jgi:hypothetical protein